MVPLAIEVLGAVIEMDCSVAAVTVRANELEVIPFWVAVTLLEPIWAPVATPPALMLTTVCVDEDQVALLVRFCVLPSLNVPVAVNCTLVPFAIEVLGEVIVIDCRVAAVTLSATVFEVIPLWVAVMLLEPTAAPVARPAAVMLTVEMLELAQVAVFVRFCVLPSLNVPVAVNCVLVPLGIEELGALMVID